MKNLDFLKVKKKMMKLSELIIPGYNPTKDIRQDPVKYEQLHDSIMGIGYAQMIAVNIRNNIIVGGSQRYKVICDLVQDYGWKLEDVEIEVIALDLNEAQEKAANSAFNNIKNQTDEEKLAAMFESIKETDELLLKLTGYEQTEINKMIDDINKIPMEKEKKEKDTNIDNKMAMFEISIKLPHQYFEIYQDYHREHGDDEIAQLIIQKIMKFGGGR